MKKLFLPSFILLLVTLIIAVIPTNAEGEIYSDTLRLHILAESDSSEDQELKLYIRDKVLKKYSRILKEENSIDGATNLASSLLSEIENDVNGWLNDAGCYSKATVTLSTEWYDTREYEDFTLPMGYYKSLRIIIGEGKGKNWWCVMYPPLCLDIATESAPKDDGLIDYNEEEIRLISNGGYNIKFKLLEMLSDIFG